MQQRPLFTTALGLAVRRPALWPAMLTAAWRFRRRDWWRRAPFLPLPAASYMEWRLDTAFGGGGAPDSAQLARYLEWTRRMRSTR